MFKLLNGDCFDLMRDLKADVVFTSPPYNRRRNDKYSHYNDDILDYFAFLKQFTSLALETGARNVIINLQTNYYNKKDVYKFMGNYADKIQQVIVWEKTNPLPANGHNITNAYELFIVLGKPLKSNTTYTKNHITTPVNSQTCTKEHRAVMKQEVADWFIEKFTQPSDKILDPFMGLGTTGVSCKKFGRDFIGIELNKDYYNEALNRIDKALL